jgi:predicted amidophosphoribosyltransferase
VCASGGGTVWNPLRQTDGISQKKLDYEGRFHHAAESITYTDRRSPVTATNSRSRTVVLVDDVFTTGATLSHCASLLRQHGIRRVFGLVFVMEP